MDTKMDRSNFDQLRQASMPESTDGISILDSLDLCLVGGGAGEVIFG
jgi:hypothetical protein